MAIATWLSKCAGCRLIHAKCDTTVRVLATHQCKETNSIVAYIVYVLTSEPDMDGSGEAGCSSGKGVLNVD